MLSRCIFVALVFITVSGLPPFRRPTWPRASTSLTSEELQDPLPWIKFPYFGNILTQFPKVVSDIAEAGPKIETDNKKFQVIINVKDYSKENLKAQIKGDFVIIQGFNNNAKNSFNSEFSQTYSLPLKANPSSVTAVLTNDGYLVLSAPLGKVSKKNKIEKVLTITDSNEPLQTQKTLIKPTDVPLLPLFKLVKDKNRDIITEIQQNHEEEKKSVLLEKKIISPTLASQEIKKQEPVSASLLANSKNNLISTESSESIEKTENDKGKLYHPKQGPQVSDKIDDTEVPENEKTTEESAKKVTFKSEQPTTQSSVDSLATLFVTSQTFDENNNKILTTVIPLLKSSLEDRNSQDQNLSQDQNNLKILSTITPLLEVITTEKNKDASKEDEKDNETPEKVATSDFNISTSPTFELFTNKQEETFSVPSETLVINYLTTVLPKVDVFTSTEALQVPTTLSGPEISADKTLEPYAVSEESSSAAKQIKKEQDGINSKSLEVQSTTPSYILENFDMETTLETIRENMADDVMLVKETFPTELADSTQNDIKVEDDEIVPRNVVESSTIILDGEVTANATEISKTITTVEQQLAITTDQTVTISEKKSIVLKNESDKPNEELTNDNIEISEADSGTEKSLPISTNQPHVDQPVS